MRRLWETILQWIYPADCAICGNPVPDSRLSCLCHDCWSSIKPLEEPLCPCCGRPFGSPIALTHSPGHLCGACRQSPPAFDQAFSPYSYEGVMAQAIHLYKYKKRTSLAAPLADLMMVWREKIPASDLVLAVPLHPTRLRMREFNQSLLLADRIARCLHLPLSIDHLVRIKATPPQTQLDRTDRAHNVKRAFTVRNPHDLEGRKILLIDDVMTTGSTVNECAKALRRVKVDRIVVLALARRL